MVVASTAHQADVNLFGKWSFDDVEVRDILLEVREKQAYIVFFEF